MKSMTGFGRGSAAGSAWAVEARLKTLNHRYLEILVRGLEEHEELELRCRRRLEEAFSRGKLDLRVELRRVDGEVLTYDPEVAQGYYQLLERLIRELGLQDEVRLEHLLALEGLFQEAEPGSGVEAEEGELWPLLEQALEEAIHAAEELRTREGERLRGELGGYLDELERDLEAVAARAPMVVEHFRERLAKRAEELLGRELDRERLEEEVVLFAERSDITEEVARLRSHIVEARAALAATGPVGQLLDFLAQEMYREVNTIAAKARDSEIAHRTVAMRLKIEKLREQVRNIE